MKQPRRKNKFTQPIIWFGNLEERGHFGCVSIDGRKWTVLKWFRESPPVNFCGGSDVNGCSIATEKFL
jgi:hypothetical protein